MLRKPYFFIPMCVLSAVAMPICGMDEDIEKNESIEESQKPKENGPQSLQHQVALGLSKALSDFLNQNKQQISNIIDNKKSTPHSSTKCNTA